MDIQDNDGWGTGALSASNPRRACTSLDVHCGEA